MGYYVRDDRGFVAQGPSLTGWKNLRGKVLLPQGGPQARAIVADGVTADPVGFVAELEGMTAPDDATGHSLAELLAAARRCKGYCAITVGLADEDVAGAVPEGKVVA